MQYKDISYVPALYKVFDEILVNAADNLQRDPKMKVLRNPSNSDVQVSYGFLWFLLGALACTNWYWYRSSKWTLTRTKASKFDMGHCCILESLVLIKSVLPSDEP